MVMRIGDIFIIPYKHVPGVMKVEKDRHHRASHVFSYQFLDNDDVPHGDTMHVHIQKLVRQIEASPADYPQEDFLVTREQALHLIRHNGIEMDYVQRLSPSDADKPGILLRWSDGKETVIDGNHRYVKRWELRRKTMTFWIVTEEQIKPCLLDLPNGYGIDPAVYDRIKRRK